MAPVCLFLASSGLVLITFVTCQNQNSFVVFQNIDSCKDGSNPSDITAEYFNAATLSCVKCTANYTVQQKSANGLGCMCRPGYRYVNNFGGGQVTCERCPGAVSDDGWECVTFAGNVNNTSTAQCRQQGYTSTAQCCQQDSISALRQVDGTYVSTTTPPEVTCLICSSDTQPNGDGDRCERCSVTLSIRNASCVCNPSEVKLKGICLSTGGTDPVLPADSPSLYTVPLMNGNGITSYYLAQNVRADYALCRTYRSATACQSLANMCVLFWYRGMDNTGSNNPTPCSLFQLITGSEFLALKPPIIVTVDADNEIVNEELTTQWTVDPVMRFPFRVGQFSLQGEFEGYKDITGGFLQLCKAEDNILDAAYNFGTYYRQSCSLSAISLWDQARYPLKFFEIYLEYTDTTGSKNLYRIPNKILNYIDSRGTRVNLESMKDWKLTRRFFLVDNLATRTTAGQDAANVRYAKNINLVIEMQADAADGRINIPYLDIEYDDVSLELAKNGAKVQVSFRVTYSMSQGAYSRNFQIAVGTLSCLAVLYAGFRTYIWSRRAGRLTIDFPTLVNFIFYLCGALSNCFFVIVFGVAFYFFIFYKRQNVFFVAHPEGEVYEVWLALFGTAFALKSLALLHMIIMQSSADIFLIDWERPVGQSDLIGDSEKQPVKRAGSSVSIWRTYFVANEWNEIQTKRKINRVFQIFAVLFFLVVIGFEDTTTKDPDGSVNKGPDVYRSDQSPVYRMALASLVYILVAVVQAIFFVFVYERFISDDIREFVDLCSMSNVSMFVMAHAEFGYYIHGRSVHGRSDVNLQEMFEMLSREEKDLVGQRGLVPNTEPQTFSMALPKRLRQKYETVYMPVQLESASAVSRGGRGRNRDKTVEAYGTLNRFLCAFIDHSLRDIDYVVKERSFLEKILDTEFLELTDKGILYNDNGHSFDNVLFYGNEFMLIIFDTLFFCIVDLIFMDYVLAGIVTYVATEVICLIRDTAGRKNLVKKTLVDERFLI